MSSLLFQVSITLLLLPFLSFSTANLVDIDGNPIINGGNYYIIVIDYQGGLTYIHKEEFCPLYITPENRPYTPHSKIPIKISSPLKTPFITLDERVSLAFIGYSPCNDSLVWRHTLNPLTQKVYITTGGVEGDRSFSIIKEEETELPFYELKYWPSSEEEVGSANVGLYEDDELLGLTSDAISVYFKKAFNNLELSTS